MTPTRPPSAFAGNTMEQNFVRDEQPAFDSQMVQRGQTPMVQQVEPNSNPNPFAEMSNAIPQQPMNDVPQDMVQQQQAEAMQPRQPLPFFRPPGAMQTPPFVGYQRSFDDVPRPPPQAGPQFQVPPIYPMMPAPLPPRFPFRMPPQFPPQFPPRLPQMPPMFPPRPPFYPLMYPPMQPPPGMGYPPFQDNNDDDRPSVNVSVETSRSKIVKKTAKKT